MNFRNSVTPESLRELLDYNAETGDLIWRNRCEKWFKDSRSHKVWNTKFANKPALTTIHNGYRCGTILQEVYRAHRVVWAIYYGEWPSEFIDHINGDRSDNRIQNLRVADSSTNGRNKRLLTCNKSGFHGVSYIKDRSKWYASIKVNGKTIGLGRFSNKPDAIKAREAAEKKYGFHANHGKFT